MTQKRIAIVQSNYIPWKGYIDLLAAVDELVLYDDMQYTRSDWRNRNLIKTDAGLKWLSIPVESKGKFLQKINETRIADSAWQKKHLATLKHWYRQASCFAETMEWLEPLYTATNYNLLSEVNRVFLQGICSFLEIKTTLTSSSEYQLEGDRNQRLAYICQQAGAHTYLSGPAAKTYMDENVFASQHIQVQWMDYTGYPEYHQFYPPFEHRVTVLDLLFHCGKHARNYLKCRHA